MTTPDELGADSDAVSSRVGTCLQTSAPGSCASRATRTRRSAAKSPRCCGARGGRGVARPARALVCRARTKSAALPRLVPRAVSSARSRSWTGSAPAEWARSIAPATRGSIARSPSRCSRATSQATRAAVSGSSARRGRSRSWHIRTSARSTMSALAPVEGGEVPFLVMELLEGESLATRLARGPLPVDAGARGCATEIAEALAAAHALDIVHRDLKPANIMLTKAGVKLLDFGLARWRAPIIRRPRGGPGRLVTGSTSDGLILGMLPYMAPEQFRGEEVDARADLFAFGAVLYEMLTGDALRRRLAGGADCCDPRAPPAPSHHAAAADPTRARTCRGDLSRAGVPG